ncbi:uncharacterized protein [Ptychodera flava]|uniref:uncharacterized protein n=1 Tax=Ptychodera flava TaxID=63121 RepID=UPI003969D806
MEDFDNEEHKSQCSFLSLPTLPVGSRKLRYLYLLPPSSATLQCAGEKVDAIPLFLATDVITGSSISSNNQPRAHARFAKTGLATKLTFQEGIKLYGIHGIAKGVWFYSVQGVMRVAFEHLGKEEQLACMTNLQELWKARYNDPSLRVSYAVTLDIPEDNEHSVGTGFSTEECLAAHKKQNAVQTKESMHASMPDAVLLSKSFRCHSYQIQHCTVTVQETLYSDRDQSNDQESCNITENKLLEEVSELLTKSSSSNASHPATAAILKSIVEIRKIESRLLNGVMDFEHFPWKLIRDYEQGLVTFSENLPHDFTVDMVHNLSLDVVCAWLGGKFKKMTTSISNNVDKFKADHISCIDNLPPAEQLIDALFPRSMKILFATWIGIKDNESQQPGDLSGNVADRASASSKTKTPQQQSQPRQRFSRYPLVQLILEFANQTLISGTAHVLYSRLIQV